METIEMTDLYPPKASSQASELGSEDFWTYEAVLERLIDTMRLWWRSPGSGRWPFASDAPWHLMTRKTRIEAGDFKGREMQLRMQAEDAEEAKRWEGRDRSGPLSRDEVALRDETTEWLTWIEADSRKVVVAAVAQLASGRNSVDWRRVKAALGAEVAAKGLYRRYTRAITAIAKRLNGYPVRATV
jgi:hypothetical protein